MRIGFTGSRHGMTDAQRLRLLQHLTRLRGRVSEFHHGDCVGSDEEAHDLATALELLTVSHPPEDDKLRARCAAWQTRDAKPYLERNRDIVDETDHLIAAPSGRPHRRSGTWMTVRYARSSGKPVTVIEP